MCVCACNHIPPFLTTHVYDRVKPQSQGDSSAVEDNQKGYDVVLAEHQEGLQCSECDLVLRDAVQTCEGIRVCRPCYDSIAR